MYLDDPAKWPALAQALRTAGEFGLDTETYGQPDRTSPQHRARVQCWSLGLLTATTSPRGYQRAVGVVLPAAALDDPALRAVLEDPRVRKWAHNAPHDIHSLRNMGVAIAGMEDTLQWLRVTVPGLGDYGLKAAEQWALGYGPRPGFLDMVKYEVTVVKARGRREQGCICGKKPCRARSSSEWWDEQQGWWRHHDRVTWRVFTPVSRQEERRYDIREFTPEHPRWAEWLAYALADAVRGMELVSWIRTRKQSRVPYPWVSRPLP